MLSLLEQAFILVTTNPGNLAYHLVITFAVAGALQASLVNWRSDGYPENKRMVVGLSLLLVIRLGLFVAAALAWQNLLVSPQALAPIDRAVTFLSLIIVIWLWVFPRPLKLADAATIILGLLMLTLSIASLVWWMEQGEGMLYNGSWLDVTGESLAILLSLLGILALLLRRPSAWGMGLGMLALLFAGHFSHWFAPLPEGDYPGSVRLAQMAAFLFLFALPQRFIIRPEAPAFQAQALLPREIPRFSQDQQFLQQIFGLAAASSAEQAHRQISHIVARLMLADVCLLTSLPENKDKLMALGGYNLSKEESIAGFNISGQMGQVVGNALRRGRPIRLPAATATADLLGLSEALGTGHAGHLLAAPIVSSGMTVAGLILLSPYSNRGWTIEDQSRLVDLAASLEQVLQHTESTTALYNELSRAKTSLEELSLELQQTQGENKDLISQLETARQHASQEHARAESLAVLVATHEEAQAKVANLEAEMETLRNQASAIKENSPPEVEHLEGELRLALEELASLKSSLSESDRNKLEQALHSPARRPLSSEQMQVLASISQELRQPLSSIIGYTDLLLGESIGILGALQRKFLERVRASTERMAALVEDLIQIAILKDENKDLSPRTIDLNGLIDEAIALTISQMREKNIVFRLDIPRHLPPLHADRDAIQQILIHLLQNACSATPIEGEISLHARVREEEGKQDYVLLQVTDAGGGIPAEDLPKVFSRLYRADNLVISGIGDAGVGLSIVKSLVEAHGGRIWVDTECKKGSTFSVLLPIHTRELADRIQGEAEA